MNHKTEVENASNLLLALAGDISLRESRIRKSGSWCYFCASTESLVTCGCGLPESLQCIGLRLCPDCRSAHRTIAAHLKRMFAAKVVDRVSSIRAKLFGQILGAADELEENSALPLERTLHCAIAQADPYEDEPREFRATIQGAFRQARFSDFQGLAKQLAREVDSELANKVAHWLSCGARPGGGHPLLARPRRQINYRTLRACRLGRAACGRFEA
jgi:hypothetical protein